MSQRYRRWLGSTAIATLTATALVPAAEQAQAPAGASTAARSTYKAPRTADGTPDLQGVWANNSATPLERPKELEGRKFLTDAEVERLKSRASELFSGEGDAAFGEEIFVAALSGREKYVADSFDKETGNYNSYWLADRDFDNRTSLITDPDDGRVPPLTPMGEKRMAEEMKRLIGGAKADSHEDRPLSERCITFGFPDLLAGYNSYYQIVQTPGWVAIATERIHDVRMIPMDGRPHVDGDIRMLNGDSRGRWEGDTLVVETRNFSPKSPFRGAAENLEIIERFTRVGPKTLAYEVTVKDPTIWTKPWTFMIPLKHSEEKIYEYACHEGNTGLVGVLSGARALEQQGRAK